MQVESTFAYQGRRDRILSIEFPPVGEIRWRKIVRRSGMRPTGKYPSWKAKRMLQWESLNELNVFRLLDATPDVRTFCEQPVKITFILDGQRHYHIPDVLVANNQGKAIWEVKTEADAMRPEIQHRTNFLAMSLPAHGYIYQTVLAEDLAKQPRLNAICDVLHFGRDDVPALERERIRNLLAYSPAPITWGAVVDGALGSRARSHFCRLMLEGSITWHPDVPLTRSTVLSANPVFAQSTAKREA